MKPLALLYPLFRRAAPALALLLVGCATSSFHAGTAPHIDRSASWVVAPLINNTATPYAGDRSARLVSALLGQHQLGAILDAPVIPNASGLPLDNGQADEKVAATFAAKQGAHYLVTGSVDEWHYKIGLDGQPAVGFTLSLVDVGSGKILWTGAASASGGSREGVAVLAQKTLNKLIQRMTGN